MSDLAGNVVDLEVVDLFGTTLAGQDIGPSGFNSAPDGRNKAHPGDDDATQFHGQLSADLADSLGEEGHGITEGLD
jgi:hypothetical protein